MGFLKLMMTVEETGDGDYGNVNNDYDKVAG